MAKQITPETVAYRLQNGEDVLILDVRENKEVEEGKIPGAKHIPLGHIALRKAELNKNDTYVVVCKSGNRSKAACGILEALGYKAEDMIGGMDDWNGELDKKLYL